MQQKIRITDLLYPHILPLGLAFVAVVGESLTDLLEPWPLKVVFDNILGAKRLSPWLAAFVHPVFGEDKESLVVFVAFAVVAIATVGAACSYAEKYLTTSVAQ